MTQKPLAWTRPRMPVVLGLAGLTTCLLVDGIALTLGVAAAGAAAVFLEPLAKVFVAAGAVLALLIGVRWLRRRGVTCSTTAGSSESARPWCGAQAPPQDLEQHT